MKTKIAVIIAVIGLVLPSSLMALTKQESANKALVLKVYQGLFGDHDGSVIDKYFKKDYFQHNPMATTGAKGLKDFFYGFGLDKAPKSKVRFIRTAAEGDLVWLYTIFNFGQGDNAVVDIFRIENGKIAEHWDVIQPIPAKSASGHTMTEDMQ